MKKFFALTLAVAMVLSLASVAFATVDVVGPNTTSGVKLLSEDFKTYNKDTKQWATPDSGKTVKFGTTLYLLFMTPEYKDVTSADAVKGLKVDAKWEKNGDYVKSVEIVKVGGQYGVAFVTTGSSLEEVEVLGEMTVKGKTYWEEADKTKKESVEFKYDVEIDLAWPGVDGDVEATDGMTVTDKTIYQFKNVDEDTAEDFVINFGDYVEVETNVKNTKKVLLGCSTKVNDDLVDEYIDADLEFYTCTGSFRRTATVTIDAEEGSYLYENVDGKLVEVDAEYDEWDEAFTFKTKKMGAYVVSNMKLDTTAAVETAPANPSTGAAA